MNILSFGTEQKLFDPGSRVYKRIFEYSTFAELYYNFVFTNDKSAKKTVNKNFIVVPVYGKNKMYQIIRLLLVLRKQKIKKNNLLVTSQDPFEIGFVSLVVAKCFKARLLVQMHSDISTEAYKTESLRNRFQSHIADYVFARADKIRVVSSRMKYFLTDTLRVPRERIEILPIFSVLSKSNIEQKSDTQTILMLCRIEKVKQIPVAIEAVSILRERTSIDYKLKIVGAGSQKKKLQAKYSSFPWVIWLPFTENVEKEYQSANCLLISSLYEGFAMTAVESISFGTPVVMTNVGCAGDIVVEGLNGSIAKDFTKESLAEAVMRTTDAHYTVAGLRQSLETLGTKEEYIQKMKELHTF